MVEKSGKNKEKKRQKSKDDRIKDVSLWTNSQKNDKIIEDKASKKVKEIKVRSDIKEEDIGKVERPQTLAGFLWEEVAIYVFIVIFILAIVIGFLSYTPTSNDTVEKTVETSRIVYQKQYLNSSFSKYANIVDTSYKQEVSLTGYLKEEYIKKNSDTIFKTRYIIDESNNSIRLDLGIYALDKYEQLFIANSTTKDAYAVNGLFSYNGFQFQIKVMNITRQDVIGTEVPVTIYENTTVLEQLNTTSSFNFSVGFGKFRKFLRI